MISDEEKKEWQDAISSGFDRLVAYATEVDKRRKSSDSNSPKQQQSPLRQQPQPNNVINNNVDSERRSTLSMKFKGTARYQRPNSPSRVPTPGSGSSSSRPRSRSPIPGEHLPEHHPKKRYFAESMMKRSNCQSPGSNQGSNGGNDSNAVA